MNYHALALPQLITESDAIAADADTLFGRLTAAQLNWKPSPDRWSVAQCLDHLINANRAMHGPIDEVIAGTKHTRWLERLPGFAALCGWIMVTSLEPTSTRKLTAPRRATPSASAIAPDIVARFVAQQRETIQRMKSLDARNAAHVVITSPFVNFVVYSALDACRIIVVHERRHFAQAQRVIAATGFPKS